MKRTLALCLFAALAAPAAAQQSAAPTPQAVTNAPAKVSVCFTLAQRDCGKMIVDAIRKATKAVAVQAYSFTDPEIVQAVIQAHKRGLSVAVILDKENVASNASAGAKAGHAAVGALLAAGIPVWIDREPPIAHNKTIVLDGILTIGGSYNYSRAARTVNAENVTFITGQEVATSYLTNIAARTYHAGPRFSQADLLKLRASHP